MLTGGPRLGLLGPRWTWSPTSVRGWWHLAAVGWFVPWVALFSVFLGAYAWIRRDWVWIVGDDQNLMMPAINVGQGIVPNIDFVNGYPGVTF